MKNLLARVALLVAALLAPAALGQSVSTEKPDPSKWFACKVDVQIEKTAYRTVTGTGSGTPILVDDGKTLIVTNAHVVPSEHRDRPIVVHVNGKAYPATVVDGSTTRAAGDMIDIDGPDLCFLRIDADVKAVQVRDTPLEDDETVYYCGFGGHDRTHSPPARSGRVSLRDSREHLVFTGSPIKGDSGAGVFDSKGRLVGVVWGGSSKTYAVPLKAVQRFVERPLLTRLFPRAAELLAERKGVKQLDPLTPPTTKSPAPDAPPVKK